MNDLIVSVLVSSHAVFGLQVGVPSTSLVRHGYVEFEATGRLVIDRAGEFRLRWDPHDPRNRRRYLDAVRELTSRPVPRDVL